MIWLLHLPLITCPSLPFFTLLQPFHIPWGLLNTLSLFPILGPLHLLSPSIFPPSSSPWSLHLYVTWSKKTFLTILTGIAPPLPAPSVPTQFVFFYHSWCLEWMIYLSLTTLSIPWRQGRGIQQSIPSAQNGPLHVESLRWMYWSTIFFFNIYCLFIWLCQVSCSVMHVNSCTVHTSLYLRHLGSVALHHVGP